MSYDDEDINLVIRLLNLIKKKSEKIECVKQLLAAYCGGS